MPDSPLPAKRRFSFWRFIVVLLLFSALQWIPLFQCWNCEGTGKMWMSRIKANSHSYELDLCPECRGRGIIALVRKFGHSSQRNGIPTPIHPDLPAEEAFRRIESNLETARSLRIRFTSEIGETRMEGTLLLKEGNKVRFQHTEVCASHPQVHESVIVSDGVKVVEIRSYDGVRRERTEKAVPPLVVGKTSSGLLHAGLYLSQWTALEGRDPRWEHPVDGWTLLPASTAGAAMMTYRLIDNTIGSAKLTFDPATLLPLHLELERYGDKLINQFDEVTINPELPDSRFRLPGEN